MRLAACSLDNKSPPTNNNNNNNQNNRNNPNFKCRVCGKSRFRSQRALDMHMAAHPATTRRTNNKSSNRGPNTSQSVYRPTIMGPKPNMAISNSVNAELLGSTTLGKKWAMRALHPCDDTVTGCIGVPDTTAQQEATLELRHNTVIQSPFDGDGNWDCEILTLPFADCVCVYRVRPSADAAQEWSYWKQVSPVQGQVLTGAFKPELYRLNDGQQLQQLSVPKLPTLVTQTNNFRQCFKGITVIMNCSSLYDQGYVTSGQWTGSAKIHKYRPQVGRAAEGQPPHLWSDIDVAQFIDIPLEADEIVIKCGGAGQWEAKKGIYMPMRFEQPVFDYSSAAGTTTSDSENTLANTELDILTGLPIQLLDSTQDISSVRFHDGLVWSVTPTYDGDSLASGTCITTAGLVNQNIGVTIFSGISNKSQLIVKTRTGIEVQPIEDSLLVGTVSDPPEDDPTARSMVHSTQLKMPIVYEHKYNSMGMIVPLIGKAIAAVAPHVLPWLFTKFTGLLRSKKLYNDDGMD